jgi:hypothetical protein
MIETIHLQLLLATFAGWVGRRQARVIACLIEENRVLKEQLGSSGKRLHLTDDQRRRLAVKGKPLGRKVLGTIAEYAAHYHDERNHQGIGNEIVSGAAPQIEGNVEVKERLGGLLK